MGQSFEDLYERFCEVLNGDYRNDIDRQQAIIWAMADTMKTMLENLRDASAVQ